MVKTNKYEEYGNEEFVWIRPPYSKSMIKVKTNKDEEYGNQKFVSIRLPYSKVYIKRPYSPMYENLTDEDIIKIRKDIKTQELVESFKKAITTYLQT